MYSTNCRQWFAQHAPGRLPWDSAATPANRQSLYAQFTVDLIAMLRLKELPPVICWHIEPYPVWKFTSQLGARRQRCSAREISDLISVWASLKGLDLSDQDLVVEVSARQFKAVLVVSHLLALDQPATNPQEIQIFGSGR